MIHNLNISQQSSSFKKVENALPTNLNKRGKILTTLAKKYQMRIVLKDKSGQRQQELADEEKEWIRKHLDSTDTFHHEFWTERQHLHRKNR